ncbi:hypothetical protein QTI51_31865 [Variovorax sp. J22G73]|uniref:hypothetical protein n=1 Tax=unclassified Variovorax TaxID=663243 RepID=UPI0025749963|nr:MULTISPECIES: hypothetical protein [unclassified Variovorax]MDM0009407.1 hypothetical protein [Variovorax sp. J22R203]MDM0101914.1 hypothetical protein [Variovorax sp. J22G73]
MKVSLETRKLAGTVRLALEERQNLPAVDAALQGVSAANTELGTLRKGPKAPPAWDPVCARYKEKIDSLIGSTRALTATMRDGSNKAVADAATQWADARNKAVNAAYSCAS